MLSFCTARNSKDGSVRGSKDGNEARQRWRGAAVRASMLGNADDVKPSRMGFSETGAG